VPGNQEEKKETLQGGKEEEKHKRWCPNPKKIPSADFKKKK